VVLAVGAVLATTRLADAAAGPDLAVSTSVLQFQPPATLPDTGTATVTVRNVGTTRPSSARLELDTVSQLDRVTVDGRACRIVAVSGGTDVARCTLRSIPRPRRSVALAVTVELASPPGDCSCVPFTVRLTVSGDPDPSNNVATADIAR
jgi:hypothetical protein